MAIKPDVAQHLFANRPAKVQVGDRRLLTEEGLKLPLSDGVKVALARVFARRIDAKEFQVCVFFRGEGKQELVTQELVVQCQLPETMALVGHTQGTCGQRERERSEKLNGSRSLKKKKKKK